MSELSESALLAKQMVEIPSYIDAGHDERLVVDFIEDYAKNHLPSLAITRYQLDGEKRANILLKGKKPTKLLFVGHVDTVPPSDGWDTEPLEVVSRGGRLYGLGVADMKGSIACLLIALQNIKKSLLDEVAVLLYVDEEYNFAGMRQVIRDKIYTSSNQPSLVISMDGHLEILTGCRGLIKVDIETVGKSGHASNPHNGINVIMKTVEAYQALERLVGGYFGANLGHSTMNVALMQAGAVEDIDDPVDMQTVGNVIPNYAKSILEIRPATPKLNGEEVRRILVPEFESRGLVVKSFEVEHDLGAWPGSADDTQMISFLQNCYKQSGVDWKESDPQYIGFIDVQILAETITSPTYVIGAGGENLHGANENVSLANLDQATALYQTITTKFLGGE